MSGNTNKKPNTALWQARQRSDLPQKTVAFLLGHKFTDLISRYERGEIVPSLSVALKLEVIYKAPVRMLFQHQYQSALWQVRERAAEVAAIIKEDRISLQILAKQLNEETYCHYTELLSVPNLPAIERERIRIHVTNLAKQLNRYG